MRKRVLLAALLFSPLVHGAAPTMGQHGMALFGGADALYASHLPMFHAPHDYQVVVKLHLADQALDARLRRTLGRKVALWTLAPEQFELARLGPGSKQPLTRFKADIVEGHFEQGGATRYAGATVIVDQVLVFRQLSAAPRKVAASRYLQLGRGRARFLVKQIDSRPDFDHIIAIRTRAAAAGAPVSVPKTALAPPGAAQIGAALPGATVLGTVYFCTEDLK